MGICAADSSGVATDTSFPGLPVGLDARAVRAETKLTPAGGAPAAEVATASGGTDGVALDAAGVISLNTGEISAAAQAQCVNGAVQFSGSSDIASLALNVGPLSLPVTVPLDQGQQTVALPLGLGSVTVHERVQDGNSLTERALHVSLNGTQLTGPGDVVVGEARVANNGSVCSATDRDNGTNPPNGGGNGSGSDRANGGKPISLAEARRLYGNIACLRGTGPGTVIVGTSGNDRITGTEGRDRILGLGGNDNLSGGGAADCVDGGTGRDVLSGSLGDDQLRGGNGSDALNGGSGKDKLVGGRSGDSINTGFGADRVAGNGGGDSINASTAGPKAHVNCGAGKDKARINTNERKLERGCEKVYTIR